MRLPALTELATAKDNTEEFKGYNQNLRNEVGEWYDQKNMTTDYYPTASPRDKRAVQTYPKGIQLPLSYSDYGVKPEGLGIAYTDNRLFTLQPFSYGEETIGAWFVDNGKLACITAGDSGKIFNNVQFSIHPSINFDNEYDSFQTITISDGKNNKNTNAEYYIRTRPGAGSLPVYAGIYNKNSRKFYNSVSSSGGTMHLIWSFYSSPIWEFYDTTGYNMVASSPFSLTKTTVINIPSSMPKYGSNGLKAFISCEDNEQSSIVIYRAGRETDVQEDHPDDNVSQASVQINNFNDLADYLNDNIEKVLGLDPISGDEVYLQLTADITESESEFLNSLIENNADVKIEAYKGDDISFTICDIAPFEFNSSGVKFYIDDFQGVLKALNNSNSADKINLYEYSRASVLDEISINKNRYFKKDIVNRSIFRMGSNICAFPDGVIYETANQKEDVPVFPIEQSKTISEIEKDGTASAKLRITLAIENPNGSGYSMSPLVLNETKYRISSENLQEYLTESALWVNKKAYTVIHYNLFGDNSVPDAVDVFEPFKVGDVVTISIDDDSDAEGELKGIFKEKEATAKIVHIGRFSDGRKALTIEGLTYAQITSGSSTSNIRYYDVNKITIKRKKPDISLACESQNRIWACSKDGHEIYASALGDPYNFYDYGGLATDSYAVNVGTDGVFTGCVNYLGRPLFFKENALHEISGSYPSNLGEMDGMSYAVTTTTDFKGVEKGSEKSLAIIDNILYYKSSAGIVAYDGANTLVISDDLGKEKYKNAVAGVYKNKYYVSMQDKSGAYHLFVYDTELGTWCKEDNTRVLQFLKVNNELLYLNAEDNKIYSVSDEDVLELGDYQPEKDFEWECETGNFGYSYPNNKYLSRFQVRMQIADGARAAIYIQYNSDGVWHRKGEMAGKGIKTYLFPIVPVRCDHMKIKIAGKGEVKIFSIAKIFEEGGDV